MDDSRGSLDETPRGHGVRFSAPRPHYALKFENAGRFHSENASNVFRPHYTPEKIENATITGHFGFMFEESSVKEIT